MKSLRGLSKTKQKTSMPDKANSSVNQVAIFLMTSLKFQRKKLAGQDRLPLMYQERLNQI